MRVSFLCTKYEIREQRGIDSIKERLGQALAGGAHPRHIGLVRFPMAEYRNNKNTAPKGGISIGGAEGNRTPVRRQLDKTFSERRLLFTFPQPGGNKHPTGISSFMMRGMGKAYHTHGLHSDHTRARLVDLPGRMGA